MFIVNIDVNFQSLNDRAPCYHQNVCVLILTMFHIDSPNLFIEKLPIKCCCLLIL